MNELLKRKPNRLKDFDYGAGYSYFITICTKNREKILSNITVGTGKTPLYQNLFPHLKDFAARSLALILGKVGFTTM